MPEHMNPIPCEPCWNLQHGRSCMDPDHVGCNHFAERNDDWTTVNQCDRVSRVAPHREPQWRTIPDAGLGITSGSGYRYGVVYGAKAPTNQMLYEFRRGIHVRSRT